MNEIPPYARLVAIGMTVAAAIGLVVNHFLGVEAQGAARLMILSIGPIAFMIGLGGIVEPKILWALGKYGDHLPFKYKVIGGILGGIGLLLTLVLVFLVYPLNL